MSEQEVQWGEWHDGATGMIRRYGYALKDVSARKIDYAAPAYLNALENCGRRQRSTTR